MLLLSAIALFNPERSNVLHKDVVKLEQVGDGLRLAIFYLKIIFYIFLTSYSARLNWVSTYLLGYVCILRCHYCAQ